MWTLGSRSSRTRLRVPHLESAVQNRADRLRPEAPKGASGVRDWGIGFRVRGKECTVEVGGSSPRSAASWFRDEDLGFRLRGSAACRQDCTAPLRSQILNGVHERDIHILAEHMDSHRGPYTQSPRPRSNGSGDTSPCQVTPVILQGGVSPLVVSPLGIQCNERIA